MGQRTKVELDIEAFAELRGSHKTLLHELHHSRAECTDLRRDFTVLKMTHAHTAIREQELEKQNILLLEARKHLTMKEAEATHRAVETERALKVSRAHEEELRSRFLDLEDFKVRAAGDIKMLMLERDKLRQAAESISKKGKLGKTALAKRGLGLSAGPAGSMLRNAGAASRIDMGKRK